jgi:predicted TIM-barrel fold metal-dependent hydrolase
MIIDSHTHIFENWFGPCGHPSKKIHLKYLHKLATRTVAKTMRKRDGALVDGSLLYLKGDNTWNGLREDVHLHVGIYGRLEYTVDGEDYYVQYMPAAMKEIEAPPELLLAQMNLVGIDHCVLQAGMTYGVMNDYNALAQHDYPHKFTGLFHLDEPLADTKHWMEEAKRAFSHLKLRGLFYQTDTFSRYGFNWWFDDKRFDEFWEMIASFDIPIFFEPSSVPDYNEASYIEIIKRLDGLLIRFPQMRWLLAGCPPVQYFGRSGSWDFPQEVAKTLARENLQMELNFPIVWGDKWDYPYPEAQALIKGLRDRWGAQKLIWGSDMPNVERYCTYKQCLDHVRRYCEFLTFREKDLILGGNVRDLCKIDMSLPSEVTS